MTAHSSFDRSGVAVDSTSPAARQGAPGPGVAAGDGHPKDAATDGLRDLDSVSS